MRVGLWIGLAAMGVALAAAPRANAQSCDDFDPCTRNDMCNGEGLCMGVPGGSGSCDDGDDCTVNDRCDAELGCTGDPATPGTSCAGGCGACTALSPIPIPGLPLFCIGDLGDNGNACDSGLELGKCFEGSCLIIGTSEFATALCIPEQKDCPINGCRGGCNPNTGQCDNNQSACFGECERCNQQANRCEPANLGQACESFDPCTPQAVCDAIDFGGETRGLCVPGEPSGETPTPTATSLAEVTATATQPPTAPPTATRTMGPPPTLGACIGDCNGNGEIAINELITGVNIALGSANVGTCPSFDSNSSGDVGINELIAAVNASLNGCVG